MERQSALPFHFIFHINMFTVYRFAILLVLINTTISYGQKRYSIEGTLTAKKNILSNKAQHDGLYEHTYKYQSKICLQGDISIRYNLNRSFAFGVGIGLGYSNNGIRFAYESAYLTISQTTGSNTIYLNFPVTFSWRPLPNIACATGPSIRLNTDFERTYGTNYIKKGDSDAGFSYDISAPFTNDFWSYAWAASVVVSLSKRVSVLAAAHYEFKTNYPRTSIRNTIYTAQEEKLFLYNGSPKVWSLAAGIQYSFSKFHNYHKKQSPYECPAW